MQIEEHVVWGRSFPVRYLLAREDEDEDGEDQFWGRCVGVEGLFVDVVPPPSEVLTLRGCTPVGPLHEAVFRSGNATRLLGDMRVEVWDDQQPVQWWNLANAVVIAHQVNQTDPALVDVVVGAGVNERESFFTTPPSPRFELFAGTTLAAEPAGRCLRVDGLFASRELPPKIPLQLIGCEPAEPLLAVLRRPRPWERDWMEVCPLDSSGRVMQRLPVGLEISGARPSVLGASLIDVTLTDGGWDRPSLAARPIWESWYQGAPTTPNQWARYTSRGRAEWLALTAADMSSRVPDRSGGVHHLDGRFATDVPGLHCALAEAIVGPGRYFGRGWEAFRDCLNGGFGVVPPFTLIWHDADIARRALADVISGPERRLSYVEDIVQLFERHGATVVLK